MRKYLSGEALEKRLLNDYERHTGQDIYVHYMEQITNASINSKGESSMESKTLLNLYNACRKEIEDATREADAKIYLPQIKKLTEKVEQANNEIAYLKSRLALYESV